MAPRCNIALALCDGRGKNAIEALLLTCRLVILVLRGLRQEKTIGQTG